MRSFLRAASFFSVALMALCLPTHGGVVPVSRHSEVFITGEGAPGSFSDQAETDQLGPFNEQLTGSLQHDVGTTRCLALQDSEVDPVTGVASAFTQVQAVIANEDSSSEARSSFLYLFDVTKQPLEVNLHGFVQATQNVRTRVALTSPDGQAVFFERLLDDEAGPSMPYNEDLVLAEGRYALVAESRAEGPFVPGVGSVSTDGSFFVEMDIGNPVPLPAAVWTGFAGLLLCLGAVRRFSRGLTVSPSPLMPRGLDR